MEGTISTWNAAITLARLCLGPGLLALPFATTKGGLLLAPIGIILVAAWNGISCLMMIKCRYAADKLDIPVPAGVLSTYSTVAYKGLGWVGVFLADSSLIVTLLGVCCAYQINFATLMIDIPFINTHFSLTGLIIVNALLVAPLSLAKDLSSLASMSSVGLACIFLNIIAVMVYGYLLYGDTVISELSHHSAPISDSVNHLKHLTSFPSSISDAASYFGVVVFCFGICAFAFPIEETMSDCKQFYLAVTGCLVLVCGIYMIVGDGAVVLYNHDIKGVQGNILLNLPLDSWFAITARVSMAAVCVLTYPLTLMPVCSLAENMITAVSSKATNVSIHTTTTSGATTSVGTTTGSVVAGQSGNTIPSTEVVSSPEQTHSLRNSRTRPLRANSDCNPPDMYSAASISIYPVRSNDAQDDASMTVGDRSQIHIATSSILFHNTLRLIFVVLTTVCAAYVPCFGLVVSLLGCLAISVMSFVLPPILHLQLVTLPAIRAAHLSTGGGKDRDRHSGENLYNSSKDYTWRNDYDTFGHTNIDFQQQNRQSANSQSPVALPSTKMIESNIADYDTEVGFTDSVDSSDDRGINRSKDRELSIDSHGFEDDEDQPLLTSSQTNSQSKSQSQLQPYNSRNRSLSGRISTTKADIISSTTQKSKSTPSNHHHNTINTTSSSMKDGMTDDYSISMTRPWLSPYKQRVLDWVLIIAGVFMCIFGTTVTFLQIMNQFNHSHTC